MRVGFIVEASLPTCGRCRRRQFDFVWRMYIGLLRHSTANHALCKLRSTAFARSSTALRIGLPPEGCRCGEVASMSEAGGDDERTFPDPSLAHGGGQSHRHSRPIE